MTFFLELESIFKIIESWCAEISFADLLEMNLTFCLLWGEIFRYFYLGEISAVCFAHFLLPSDFLKCRNKVSCSSWKLTCTQTVRQGDIPDIPSTWIYSIGFCTWPFPWIYTSQDVGMMSEGRVTIDSWCGNDDRSCTRSGKWLVSYWKKASWLAPFVPAPARD